MFALLIGRGFPYAFLRLYKPLLYILHIYVRLYVVESFRFTPLIFNDRPLLPRMQGACASRHISRYRNPYFYVKAKRKDRLTKGGQNFVEIGLIIILFYINNIPSGHTHNMESIDKKYNQINPDFGQKETFFPLIIFTPFM